MEICAEFYNPAQNPWMERGVIGPGAEPPIVHLLNGALSNCLLNIYVCTYRPQILSALIRDASFCSEHQLMERYIAGQNAKNKKLDATLQRTAILPHTHTKAQELLKRGRERNVRVETWK